MPFRLFLSHSTPVADRARLKSVVDGIHAESDGKIKVLVDVEQIASGDEWRRRISYLLHACDGAAILLDRAAFGSPWVLAESTFLSLRAVWDERFPLIPLSLLSRAELKLLLESPSWRPVALPHRQFADGVDDIAPVVAAALTSVAQRTPGRSPMERLAHQIGEELRHAPPALLHDLADCLGDDMPYDDRDDHVRAALVLAREMIMQPNLTDVRALLGELGARCVRSYGAAILEQLESLPIDPHGAAALRSGSPHEGGHSWLQTERALFTAPLYVARAYLTYEPAQMVMLSRPTSAA